MTRWHVYSEIFCSALDIAASVLWFVLVTGLSLDVLLVWDQKILPFAFKALSLMDLQHPALERGRVHCQQVTEGF